MSNSHKLTELSINATVVDNVMSITLPVSPYGYKPWDPSPDTADAEGDPMYYNLDPFTLDLGDTLLIEGERMVWRITPEIISGYKSESDSAEYQLHNQLIRLRKTLNIPLDARVRPEKWTHICGRADMPPLYHRYARDVSEEHVEKYLNDTFGPRLLPYDRKKEAAQSPYVWIVRSPVGTNRCENDTVLRVCKSVFETVYRRIDVALINLLHSPYRAGGLAQPIPSNTDLYEDQQLIWNPTGLN